MLKTKLGVILAAGFFLLPGSACAESTGPGERSGLRLLRPQTATTAELLRHPAHADTAPRLFRWAEHPAVFVLQFRDKQTQSRAMNRIAAFVEKKGSRGRILSDASLADFIRSTGTGPAEFYWAHDYRQADLIRFFAAARLFSRKEGKAVLNAHEEDLAHLLGQIWPERGREQRSYVLLTIPAAIPATTRRLLLLHELRHALYFTQPEYRTRVAQVWEKELDDFDREAITLTLSLLYYDPTDRYLIQNEFQSFLLEREAPFVGYVRRAQQRDASGRLARYLTERPGRHKEIGRKLRRRLGSLHLE